MNLGDTKIIAWIQTYSTYEYILQLIELLLHLNA